MTNSSLLDGGRRPVPERGVHPSGAVARLVQAVGGFILRMAARFLYRCEIRFDAPLPPPPLLLAANHRAYLDPPAVGMCLRDPIAYFARSSLWKNPAIRVFLSLMKGIPVDREAPGASALRGAVQRLREGISVLVFPEGTRTRSGRLGPMREGPALFARRAGVPVVPVYLFRSDAAWPRGQPLPRLGGCRIAIRFGRPIVAPADLPVREQDAWVTRRLEAWLHAAERDMYAKGGACGRPARGIDPAAR